MHSNSQPHLLMNVALQTYRTGRSACGIAIRLQDIQPGVQIPVGQELHLLIMYLCSVGGKATRQKARQSGVRILVEARDFSYLKMFRLVLGPISHLHNGYQSSYPKIKPLGCEVNHTPPSSSTKVKNEWSYHFYSPTCLHSVDRENLIFNFSECDCICMCNMTECIHTSAVQ